MGAVSLAWCSADDHDAGPGETEDDPGSVEVDLHSV